MGIFSNLFKKKQPPKAFEPYVLHTDIGDFTMLYRHGSEKSRDARVPTGEFLGKVRWNGNAELIRASFHCDDGNEPLVAQNGLKRLKEVLAAASTLEQQAKQYILDTISDEATEEYAMWEKYRKPAYNISRAEFVSRLHPELVKVSDTDEGPNGTETQVYLFFQLEGEDQYADQYYVIIDEQDRCVYLGEL